MAGASLPLHTIPSLLFTSLLNAVRQVSRGGSVHPRVLEPLISLTLSPNSEDTDIAKKYIGERQ